MALRSRLFHAKLPSLAKEGWLRHQKNGPLPLKARPGWFVQQPIIGGLNQPPRLRPLRRLRGIFLMGAASPPWLRRGVLFGCGFAALCFCILFLFQSFSQTTASYVLCPARVFDCEAHSNAVSLVV